jgi:hypothetical protein
LQKRVQKKRNDYGKRRQDWKKEEKSKGAFEI